MGAEQFPLTQPWVHVALFNT